MREKINSSLSDSILGTVINSAGSSWNFLTSASALSYWLRGQTESIASLFLYYKEELYALRSCKAMLQVIVSPGLWENLLQLIKLIYYSTPALLPFIVLQRLSYALETLGIIMFLFPYCEVCPCFGMQIWHLATETDWRILFVVL